MRTATNSVLIVTSQPELGEGIRLALQRLGVASVLAPEAVDAVQRLTDDSLRGMIVDSRFTDMDPHQVVRRAIACRELHGLPIVVFGADPDDHEPLLNDGCTVILHGDTTPLAVADAVAELLRSRAGDPSGPRLRLQPGPPAKLRPRIPATMKAAVFVAPGRIALVEKPVPQIGPRDALLQVTTTTLCGTDVHILKGEYPVAPQRIVGHEPVGVIAALGAAVVGYEIGQRVIAGAVTPCGQCEACLEGRSSQCGDGAMGGWRLGNSIDGCQAEYVRIPDATANLALIPPGLDDEQVLLCPDIMSTGFAGAESGRIRIGDSVAVFAQGPIGLCALVGARLAGATTVLTVDAIPERLALSKRLGADVTIDHAREDPVQRIREATGGRGVDVAIEALGTQTTFENCLRVLRPGGILSSLGVYSGKLMLPLDAFAAGLGDHTVVTTLCPGGKARMRRLMEVVAAGRVDLRPLVTHRFTLDRIEAAYELFVAQRDGVIKVAITA